MAYEDRELRGSPYRCPKFWKWGAAGIAGFLCFTLTLVLVADNYHVIDFYRHSGCTNAANAVAVLKQYATAQAIYRKANYAAANGLPPRSYAPSFRLLGGSNAHKMASGMPLELLPIIFSEATKRSDYQGYYYVDISTRNAKLLDCAKEFALCAVPSIYEKTGTNTFVVDQTGTVLMKDTKGIPVTDLSEVDSTWVVP